VSSPVAPSNINSMIDDPMPALAWLAIAIAVVAAGFYAQGARHQHRAVRAMTSGRPGEELGWAGLRGLSRDRVWLSGLLLLGAGTGLQVVALSLAPLTVVHPIGVLAIAFAAVLDARAARRPLDAVSITAIVGCSAGLGLFVLLAATTVSPMINDDAAADAGRLVALLAVASAAMAVAGALRARRWPCLMWTAAAGTAFGFAAALTRIVAEQVVAHGVDGAPPIAVLGVAAAGLLGGWCLQQAHAGGPTSLVVAGLTVIDPLVAVGLGLAVLGEGAGIGAGRATAMLACAAGAAAGVVVLARRRIDSVPLAGVAR